MNARAILPRALVFAGFLVALIAWRVVDHYPVPERPLRLTLELDPGPPGRSDPVLVMGRTDAGDFLSVQIEAPDLVSFAYDSWGIPAIRSRPVAYTPGQPLALEIEVPGLDQVLGGRAPVDPRVRVKVDGEVVLDSPGHFHVRETGQLWFGVNLLGGTACGPHLSGQLRDATGRDLTGSLRDQSSWTGRLHAWLVGHPGQVAAVIVFAAGLATATGALGRAAQRRGGWRALGRRHRWFLGTALVVSLPYAWMVTYGSFRWHEAEVFGSFYDYQAASFLQGRLDVPEAAIGGEAFEARGRLYGYFGPTPALLRLPFTLTGIGFGKLSRLFMLLYFAGILWCAYQLLRDALARSPDFRGQEPSSRDAAPVPSPAATVLLLAGVGLGSTVFFLASRAVIFHEAILAGIAFALASARWSLLHLRQPAPRNWVIALTCGILSLHCRPPTGLFALTLLGTVVGLEILRSRRLAWQPLSVMAACAVGFFSLNALAYAKFHTFDAAPLRLSRPYANPERLAHIDGKSFHLVNVPYNTDTYLLRWNLRFERRLPWIYLDQQTGLERFPRVKMDLPDFTLAVPYAMPSLFLLATLGGLVAAFRRPDLRRSLVALWLAVLPMTLALFAAVATAQRYTGDFCPFLIAAAAHGLAGIEAGAGALRRAGRAVTALATVAGIAVTFAITLHYQRETVWGVPEDVRRQYQSWRT